MVILGGSVFLVQKIRFFAHSGLQKLEMESGGEREEYEALKVETGK